MCGIDGYISKNNKIDAKSYYRAHVALAHRGPDDEGFYYEVGSNCGFAIGADSHTDIDNLPLITAKDQINIVIGHRRLSIIDLSSAGHQPFKKGNKILSYNGEIYNYLELRSELIELGYTFKTSTDTEVFLIAYEHWGCEAFNKFNGMWAAAIYDVEQKSLVLTRDRFGIKPLYYTSSNGDICFASELKFFKELGLGDVDEQAILQYLRYSETDFDDRTFFKNIKQLEPGCFIRFSEGKLSHHKYWTEESLDDSSSCNDSIESRLFDSIDIRLRSDVPVGSLLSGGIDSSLIVGCINELYGLKNFQSYSAVFEDEKFSEKNYIEMTASHLNMVPNYVYPKSSDLIENIERLIYVQEVPFRSLSVLSQFLIYKEVSEKGEVKVLLNGQGADEIFSGYSDHFSFYFLSLLKRLSFKKLLNELQIYCKDRGVNLLVGCSKILRDLFSQYFSNSNKYGLFNMKFKRKNIASKKTNFHDLKGKLYRDLSFSALREYLRYEDRNSMFFSLEARLPYLDYRLVKKAFSMPETSYIVDGYTKNSLREVSKGRVHNSIIKNKVKKGFVSPQEKWQRHELLEEFDQAFNDIAKNGLFTFINTSAVSKFYNDYKSGKHNDWAQVWRLYCVFKWKKIWIDNE